MKEQKPLGMVKLRNEKEGISFRGRFENGLRKGKAILNEKGKEFYVFYDHNGIEIEEKRERTFQGVRMMIVGKFILFILIQKKKKILQKILQKI